MSDDFFEIDFHEVHTSKSGDAISARYVVGGVEWIHMIDGGYASTYNDVADHIDKYYGFDKVIDNVVATHPDQDHLEGLQSILEHHSVSTLWMLRPWVYADELMSRFTGYSSVDRLISTLKKAYPYVAALERIAEEQGIEIREPFQGNYIGHFVVLAPSKSRYLDLIADSDRTPKSEATEVSSLSFILRKAFDELARKAVRLVKGQWGEELFKSAPTTRENEMSVVQFARLNGKSIVLTADAGTEALIEAAAFAPWVGLHLPGGVDRFQIPHHGSRHNLSSAVMNEWFGKILEEELAKGAERFTAIVSAASEDPEHPRQAVTRAFIHRGAKVISTEGGVKQIYYNAPARDGWSAASSVEYSDLLEDD